MKYIMDWGSAYENKTPEADEVRRQLRKTSELAEKESDPVMRKKLSGELDRLRTALLDITDNRRFCVVYDTSPGFSVVRTIFRVSEDAEGHLDEVKEEYYREYEKCEGDKFHFETGLHRARAFAENIK